MKVLLILILTLAGAWQCGVTPDFEVDLQRNSPVPRRFSGRRLSLNYTRTITEFAPIRIHVEYMDLGLSSSITTELMQTVIPAAISWFQHVLSVNPVEGMLKLDVTSCFELTVPQAHRSLGVEADYILYVYGTGTTEMYVARAGACAYDGGSRSYPVAGMLQLNTQNYNEYLSFDVRMEVVLHELTHALGFTPSIWRKFSQQNGDPYTSYNVTVNDRGANRVKLTFPTVLAKVREYFACPTLEGAELEDAGGGGTASSHWEKRIFGTDYMVGSISSIDFSFSAITLALFEDSGFYKVNYDYATPLLYGKGKGCEFHTKKCITNGVANFEEFCTVAREGCDSNNLGLGFCYIRTALTLPLANQYFSDPTQGGPDSLNDNCPYFVSYSNAKCKVTTILRSYRVQKAGVQSRCFDGTWGLKQVSSAGSCHEVTCSPTKAIVHLDNTTSVDCPVNGGNVTLSAPYVGSFPCPTFDQLCTSSPCTSACLGRGKCVVGVCVCDPGYSGIECEDQCDLHCLTCDLQNKTKCLTCVDGAQLVQDTCVCVTGMAWNLAGKCTSTACSKSCQDCSNSKCNSCWLNASLQNDGTCLCNDSFFPNSDGSLCIACSPSCKQCSGAASYQCTACYSNAYVYVSGECVCVAGYYSDSFANNCQACDSSCKTCSGSTSTTCTSCFAGASVAGTTGPCNCQSGYYPNLGPQSCSKCDASCVTCKSAICSTCPTNAVVPSGASLCACSTNFTPVTDVFTCTKTCSSTCSTCSDGSTDASQCLSCYTNAVLSGTSPSTCVCKDGYFPSPNSANCLKCHALCGTCINASPFGCTSCPTSQTVLLDFGLICTYLCPYSYQSDGKTCTARPGKAVDFLFGSYTNYPVDSVAGRMGFCGTSEYFYPSPDNGDPAPAPNAGLHFNGIFNYVTLPPNTNDTAPLSFASTHYVELWTRPETSSNSRQCLLTKSYSLVQYLNFCISPSSALTLEVIFKNFNDTNSLVPMTFTAATVTFGRSWQLMAYQFSYASLNTVVKLFRNDRVEGTFVAYRSVFVDYKGSPGNLFFILGARFNGHSYVDVFSGNIAQLVVYQGMEVVPALKTGCSCSQCSSASTCLTSCFLNETNVQGVCQLCLPSCKLGCYRTTDCSLNVDVLCSVFANATSCSSCVPYATQVAGTCACVPNSSLNTAGTGCTCNSPYQPNSGVDCVACKKYFQPGEVTAAYDPYFIKVYVSFTSKVDLAGFQSCATFISADTMVRLGTSPDCVWNSDSTVMTIVLGPGAKLLQEPIHLLPAYIFTRLDTTVCGYLPTALAPVANFVRDPPPPLAVISVPRRFSVSCGDDALVVSGAASAGAYSRALVYSWSLKSDPVTSLPDPSTLNSLASFSLPRASLVPCTLNITLYVQNLFGLNDTATVAVLVVGSPALDVEVSGGPVQRFIRSSQKVLLKANFISRCNLSGSATYQWDFVGTNATDMAAGRSAMSSQGNMVYISTAGLAPECFYVYNVTVTVGAAVGFDTVNATIVRPPLTVVISPSSGEFPVTSNLQLSASKSDDPAKLSGDISFHWTCVENITDCKASDGSVLLTSYQAADTTIQAEKLRLGAVYLFIVTLTKDIRVATESRQFTIVQGNGCLLQLPISSIRLSPDLPLTVIPTVSATDTASFSWTQLSGPSIGLRYTSSAFLSIPVGAFQAGGSYSFRLSIISSTAISAYFNVTVNWPPANGVLTVTPATGTALMDVFSLVANGWEDPDGVDYPLQYQFSAYRTVDGTLSPLRLAQRMNTKLGLGVVSVSVLVCDALSACSTISASVTVQKYLRQLQTTQSNFASDTLDSDLVPSMISAYCSSLLLSESDVRAMLTSLTAYTATQPADSSLLNLAISTVRAMQVQTQLLRNLTASWIEYELGVLSRMTGLVTASQVTQSLSLISGLLYGSQELGSVQWLVSSLLGQYLTGLMPGEDGYAYNSQGLALYAQRIVAAQMNNVSFTTSRASVSLPASFTADTGISNTTVIDLIFSHFNQTDQSSDLVSLQLLSSGKYSSGALSLSSPSNLTLSGLSTPLNMTFPARLSPSLTYDCLSQAGASCSVLNVTTSTVTISTNFLAPIYIRIHSDPKAIDPIVEIVNTEVCEAVTHR